MGRFQDYLKGGRQATGSAEAAEPAPQDDNVDSSSEADRRGTDRRQQVDLTRPAHAERRQPGGSRRRREDEELIERQPAEVQAIIAAGSPAVETGTTASVAELKAAIAKLQSSIDEISSRTKEMSVEDFEVAYARAAPVITEMSAELKRLNVQLREAVERGGESSD